MKLYRLGWIPCIYLLLLLSSCVADQRVPQGFRPIPDGMKAIDINFSVTNAREPGEMRSTKTGEVLRTATWEGIPLRAATEPGDQDQSAYDPAVLNENKIDKLDIFLVSKEGAATPIFKHFSNVEILERPTAGDEDIVYKVRVLIPSSEVSSYEGQDFDIFVVANAQVNLSAVTSIAALESTIQENDLNLLEGTTPKPQPHFLMDGKGSTGQIQFQNRLYTVAAPIDLYRAAAKIRLRVRQEIEVIDLQNGTKTDYEQQGNLQVKLVSYLHKSSLLQGKPYAAQSGDWVSTPYRDLTLRSIPVKHPGSEESTFLASFPFYAYESSWSAGLIDLQEAHLIVKAVLRPKGTNKEWKEYYYRIPLNYGRAFPGVDKESLHRVDRNHLYDVLSKIEILGGKTEEEAVEISSYVSIQPWNSPVDPVDGVIGAAQYLVVREKFPAILNEEDYEIQYASSLPVEEVEVQEVYYEYYDRAGTYHKVDKKNDVKDPFKGTVVASEPYTGGLLKIHNEIPKNYLPLHIIFKVKQKDGDLEETVHATQYPPRYVEYIESKGLGEGKSFDPTTGQAIFADFRHHAEFGNITGSGLQKNNILTRITTIVPRDGEKIGDPRDENAPGNTKTTSEASEIISPSFIIASQYGVMSPLPQYGGTNIIGWAVDGRGFNYDPYPDHIFDKYLNFGDGYGPYSTSYARRTPYYNAYNNPTSGGPVYRNYKDAGSRAKLYFEDEYGKNGVYTEYYASGYYNYYNQRKVRKEFKHNGSWRLPTAAELQTIARMQDEEPILRGLLTGPAYWCGESGKGVMIAKPYRKVDRKDRVMDPRYDQYSDVTYARLVFDVWQFPEEK